MPIYRYRSEDGDIKEITAKWSEIKDKLELEIDGKKYKRILSNFSFKLNGSGWHATDYGKGNRS